MSSHVFSIKLPHSLLKLLEKVSKEKGCSKGAFIRNALEKELHSESTSDGLDLIRKATKAMMEGKKIKMKVDWEELRRKASIPMDITPEEEVRRSRMRQL